MGIEILIPSGILWSAMARARENPKKTLLFVAIKVAMPSGMLWIIMANIEIIPTLYRLSLL